MKNRYLVSKSELVKIDIPKEYSNLIGKYYLKKLKNGKDSFHQVTGYAIEKSNIGVVLMLYSALEGELPYRFFRLNNLPAFYEMIHIDREIDRTILFNVFE